MQNNQHSNDWDFGYALPNLNICDPVDTELFLLTHIKDDRVKALINSRKIVGKFLSKFHTQFCDEVNPAVLLVRKDNPRKQIQPDVLIAFRNAFAISCIIYGVKDAIICDQPMYPVYSDNFNLYPITFSNDYKDLITRSLSTSDTNPLIDKFRGQSKPGLANTPCQAKPDKIILDELLELWKRFVKDPEQFKTNQMFRSLQMAYLASSSWSPNEVIFYDVGSKLALWISACEILLHPKGGKITRMKVIRELEKLSVNNFKKDELKQKQYEIQNEKQKCESFPLLSKLYDDLYRARCDFLHGNPVDISACFSFRNKKLPSLLKIAPVIYNALLIHDLDIVDKYNNLTRKVEPMNYLNGSNKKRSDKDEKIWMQWIEIKFPFERCLDSIEKALLKIAPDKNYSGSPHARG